jgi:hypothetical protein
LTQFTLGILKKIFCLFIKKEPMALLMGGLSIPLRPSVQPLANKAKIPAKNAAVHRVIDILTSPDPLALP